MGAAEGTAVESSPHRRKAAARGAWLLAGLAALAIVAMPSAGARAPVVTVVPPVYEVRSIPTGPFGIPRPTSLGFARGALIVGQRRGSRLAIARIGLLERLRGRSSTPLRKARRLGRTVVRRRGTSYTLAGDAIVQRSRNGAIVRRLPLPVPAGARLRGIAFNPADGLLYVLDAARRRVIAVDEAGGLRGAMSLAQLRLSRPTAIAFAPSGDPTDGPAVRHLYVADRGRGRLRGRIIEAAAARPPSTRALAAVTVTPTLVRTIHTSQFSPPSPDPAGLVYMPATDRLLISDSEVDEMTIYQGKNLFTATRTGTGTGTGTTVGSFSKEPTGLGYDPGRNVLYVSDDDADRVSIIRPGADGAFGTSDDARAYFATKPFGSTDAEGVEFDASNGHVLICDGVALEVFDVDPVNGVFGDGDDRVSSFDLAQYAARDCEGLGIDPRTDTLLAVDPSRKRVYELSKGGALLRTLDLSQLPVASRAYSAIALAPTSAADDSPSDLNYWVGNRGVDNGQDPNENDGAVFEVTTGAAQPPSDGPPTVSLTAPLEGAAVAGTVDIRAVAADDAGVTQVTFSVDDVAIGTDTDPTDGWSATWDTTRWSSGAHSVRAVATDTSGQTAADANSVTVDNEAPAVAVTAPAAGSTVSRTITLAAAAGDGDAVASVAFAVDGATVGIDSTAGDGWSVAWDTTTASAGAHAITAVATDRAGNTATSGAVEVTVANGSTGASTSVAVAAGSDDADEISDGTVRRGKGDVELGSDHGTPTVAGLRFAGLAVPRNATIESASVQFQADEKGRTATALELRAQAADHAAGFTSTPFSLSSRPVTAASVTWVVAEWYPPDAGTAQRTPNLAALVQEVVSRPGWASGNAIVLLITGAGRRTAEAFEGGAPAVLHVAYAGA